MFVQLFKPVFQAMEAELFHDQNMTTALWALICRWSTFCNVVFVIVVLNCSAGIGSDGRPPSHELVGTWKNVDRIWIEAVSEVQMYRGNEISAAHRRVAHRILAATGLQLYYYVGHDHLIGATHDEEDQSWKHEPTNCEVSICDETLVFNHEFNRKYSRSKYTKGSPLPAAVARDNLFRMLPVLPLQHYDITLTNRGKEVPVARDAIANGDYTEMSFHERVGGDECYAIISRSGHDIIWISESKPLCIMKRELLDSSTGAVVLRVSSKSVRNIAPGMWIPSHYESEQFNHVDANSEAKLVARIETRVLDFKIHDAVHDSVFTIKIPPGSLVQTGQGEYEQESPGGLDHLDNVAEYLRSRGLPRPAKMENDHTSWEVSLLRLFAGFYIGIALNVVCFKGFRTRRYGGRI